MMIVRPVCAIKWVLVWTLFLTRQGTGSDIQEGFNTSLPSQLFYEDSEGQYDYYNYDDTQSVLNLSFNKCSCGQEQLWNGSKCLPLDPDIVYNITQRIPLVTDARYQKHIIANIRERGCGGDHAVLEEGSFVFLNSESIYHEATDSVYNATHFCLEYTGSVKNVHIIAEACLPIPTISICCTEESTCSRPSSLSVNFGESAFNLSQFNTVEVGKSLCENGEIEHTSILNGNETSTSIKYLSGNVSILWQSPPPVSVPHIIPQNKYCLDVENHDQKVYVTATFCYTDPIIREEKKCAKASCLRKCCPEDLVYDMSMRKCGQSKNDSWTPNFIHYDTKQNVPEPENLHLLHGYPWCSHNGLYELDPKTDPGSNFVLVNNGSLHVTLTNTMIPFAKYCLDNFRYDDGRLSEKALVCFDPPVQEKTSLEKCKEVHGILYPILIVISCSFLAITLVVYASVPELYANLHGKSLLSHVSSLLVAYVCQLIVSWNSKSLSMMGCKIIALGTQVSFLWAFFWLNVMCFDIWWTLKSMSPRAESWESSRRKFILYSMYAWGCPLLVGFITALMEFLPQLDSRTTLILPGFGVRSCWFQNVKATWIYFHGFTLLLYVLNIFFFFHVAAILILSQRSTEGILRITRKQYKERVFLYLKLFVVMGITWICEVASWQEGTCEYWIFTDVVNSLQGMFLFFIFMCNKKVFLKVQAKSGPLLRRVKAFFKPQPPPPPPVTTNSSASQRTTQTSLETSSRRLSASSLNQEGIQFSLKTTKSGDSDTDFEKISSSSSLH